MIWQCDDTPAARLLQKAGKGVERKDGDPEREREREKLTISKFNTLPK